MKKTFCDKCDIEINEALFTINENGAFSLFSFLVGKVVFIVTPLDKEQDFDFCKTCIIDGLDRLDDRPKAI